MLKNDRIEILDYTDEFKDQVKALNYEWLEKYFYIEEEDKRILSNLKEQIIDKGGMIFLVRMDGKIVGTVSLIKMTEQIFELTKMAVIPEAQGAGIGNILVKHCLNVAKQKSIKKLILYSNTKLKAAIHLYRKYGFREVELEKGNYERTNIKMERIV